MRAKAVGQAEAIYGLSIAVMLAMAVVAWPDTVASVGPTGAILANALVIGLTLILLLLRDAAAKPRRDCGCWWC